MNDPTLRDPTNQRRATFLLICIILAGLALRLIHYWALSRSALPFRHLMAGTTDDHAFYMILIGQTHCTDWRRGQRRDALSLEILEQGLKPLVLVHIR